MQRLLSWLKKQAFLVAMSLVLAANLLFAWDHGLHRGLAGTMPANYPLNWWILSQLNLESGDVPPILTRLNSETVELSGYMVPLEDSFTEVSEFLLVPSDGSCIHMPPPPANQVVRVIMQKDAPKFTPDPITVRGVFSLEHSKDTPSTVTYQILGDLIRPYSGSKRPQ